MKHVETRDMDKKIWVEPSASKPGYWRNKHLYKRPPREKPHIKFPAQVGQTWASLLTNHSVIVVNTYPPKKLVTMRYVDGFEATLSVERFREIFTHVR